MKNIDWGEVCKWMFGSLAIAASVYWTKNPNCLWAYIFLLL